MACDVERFKKFPSHAAEGFISLPPLRGGILVGRPFGRRPSKPPRAARAFSHHWIKHARLRLFLGAILLAGLISALIAYPAYELTSTFALGRFTGVGRVAMLVLVAELVWLCRHYVSKQSAILATACPGADFSR